MVEKAIANYTRAIAKGDFSSLEDALGAAEQRKAAIQSELVKLDGKQPSAVIQVTPAALERRLEGLTEKLRSGVNGKVREVIQQSVARILVGTDGNLTIEAKPSRLLGVEGVQARSTATEDNGLMLPQTISLAAGRFWNITAGQAVEALRVSHAADRAR